MPESNPAPSLLHIPHFRILLILLLVTLISWAAWSLVVWKLDPFTATALSLSLFYSSSFLAFSGTFSLVLFFIKKLRSGDQIYVKHILSSLRQGILLSACTCLCLGLLMLGLLRIWNGLLIVAFIMLLEFYLSRKDELN